MFGAEDRAAVVVVEHVSREGALQVIAVFVFQRLALFILFVFGRFGGDCIYFSLGGASLLLFGGLGFVLSALDSGGGDDGSGSSD